VNAVAEDRCVDCEYESFVACGFRAADKVGGEISRAEKVQLEPETWMAFVNTGHTGGDML
jgi:hypothetical protein